MVNTFKKACRICLVDSDDYVSLFDDDSTEYLELIKEYAGFDIIHHEKLPSVMCKTCSFELDIVVSFISKCRSSNDKLADLLVKDDIVKEEGLMSIEIISDSNIKIEKEDEDFREYDDSEDIFPMSQLRLKRKYVRKKPYPKRKEKIEYRCETCGLKIQSNSALIIHMRKHTGERPYVCNECKKSFSQKSTLQEHIGRVHDKKQLRRRTCICDYCGKICYRRTELKAHMRVHTKEKPFKCKLCNETFTQNGSLKVHLRRHSGERPYSCHICGIGFHTPSALKSHMITHSDDKNYKCHICDKSVKTKKTLMTHLLIHTDGKPHVCDKCGTRFQQKGNLKHHILSKHSERSGDCEICKKFFSDLVTHKRFHTGEKPYKCPDCEKAFAKRSHLTIHLKRHKESKKYACTYSKCDEAFPMQCQLDFHIMKFHTKEYAYKCSGCTKGFYRLTDLRRHHNLNPTCKFFNEGEKDEELKTVMKKKKT